MSKKQDISRRHLFGILGKSVAGIMALAAFKPLKALAQKDSTPVAKPNVQPPPSAEKAVAVSGNANYDPLAHHWQMAIDIEKCIGCGLCAKACKKENKVPVEPFFFRTWVERYIIKRAAPKSGEMRGETLVDSPNGGIDGFPASGVPRDKILKSFFVPKLCNQCTDSPCTQACPVGAAFHSPYGAVLLDSSYCIGCSFCIQACPYGCRFLDPVKHTAEKCTLCYHRITKGLRPACVEVCPTGARIFGDLLNPVANDPLQNFVQNNKVQVLKPHLGTHPTVLYAGMDKEVR